MPRKNQHDLPAGIYRDKHGCYWATLTGEHAKRWNEQHPGLSIPRRKAPTSTAAAEMQRQLIDALKASRKPKAENPKVVDWVEHWIDQNEKLRRNTVTRYTQSLLYQIKPLRIGRIRLLQVSRDLVKEWINELIELPCRNNPELTLSEYSIRNAFALLRAALNEAVVHGLINANPCQGIELPSIAYNEMRFMPVEQIKHLLNVLNTYEQLEPTGEHRPHRMTAMYYVAIFCGLRKSEILGLRWSDVDWTHRVIVVSGQLQHGERVSGKSKFALRSVPFGDNVHHALTHHKQNQDEERSISTEGWNRENLIFCSEAGTPLNPANVWRQFNEFQLLAGLTDSCKACNGSGQTGKGKQTTVCGACDEQGGIASFRFHDLRHTYASLALAAKTPLFKVSRRMGHSSITVTSDFYGHLDKHDTSDADAINNLL